ncbi:aminotransferase class I/II-fold pyridoxal phosphate-dependent enzyme [Ruminiclostridium cellulolyticum]|uniref:Aminotransferase class I and II n=1 Tax=Ruminiclostridium cellulolyticum (strain ATCC 35319 / DSM 5812 / JCM 6584 / H10) TaxID=394503 RepID=B8I9E4_RUMCH|nr:aminotransferase class I/II-fold pyridoxal phosphate-dependent enzyme [Ruminiclostridium cellulolyticum]ACL75404.1 aminotransferase class I and II [Ruminiclostridium cellulolyticum H10]
MNYMNAYEDLRNVPAYYDYSLSFNRDESILEILKNIQMHEVVEMLNRYPQQSYFEFKELLGLSHPKMTVVLGSGSEDLIWRINNFILRNKKVGVILPTFYRIYQTLQEPCFINIPYDIDNEVLDICSLRKAIDEGKYEAVWITNPNPITGKGFYASELLNVIEANKDTLFIVDEASVDSVMDIDRFSMLNSGYYLKNLVVIKTFSKFYGLPGMRLGYVAISDELADCLENWGQVFPVSSFSIYMAKKILEHKKIFMDIRKKINQNRDLMTSLLNSSSTVVPYKSLTNTLVIGGRSTQYNLWQILKGKGILSFSLDEEKGMLFSNCVRITIHSGKESFDYLYNGIKELLCELEGNNRVYSVNM